MDLWDWEGERAVAQYDVFLVAGEDDLFRLTVADYSGNATDALSAHSGRPFSTRDGNHDTAPACCPCAPAYAAGWWFYRCVQQTTKLHPEKRVLVSCPMSIESSTGGMMVVPLHTVKEKLLVFQDPGCH